MRNTLAIAVKETRVYFTTWTSYVLIGAFVLITGFFFHRLVFEYQQQSMQLTQQQAQYLLEQMNLTDWVMAPLFSNITVFFLFMLPIMTMRLFAEERRGKTLELLMTTPVRPLEIVFGKYLAGVAVMATMLTMTLLFPLLLQIYGEPTSAGGGALDLASVAVGYGGMLLLGASFVAVGLFASAVTESQIVAVVISFAVLLMFYVIGLSARGATGAWQSLAEYLSMSNHLEGFVRGVVRLSDVTYYLSLIFVGLFLAFRVVEAERWR